MWCDMMSTMVWGVDGLAGGIGRLLILLITPWLEAPLEAVESPISSMGAKQPPLLCHGMDTYSWNDSWGSFWNTQSIMDEEESAEQTCLLLRCSQFLGDHKASTHHYRTVSESPLHDATTQDKKPLPTPYGHDRNPSRIIVSFNPLNPEHPKNWLKRKKMIIFYGGLYQHSAPLCSVGR